MLALKIALMVAISLFLPLWTGWRLANIEHDYSSRDAWAKQRQDILWGWMLKTIGIGFLAALILAVTVG